MQQTVSKSKFKAQALEFLRNVEKNKTPLIITHAGKPVAKVIPYKEEVKSVEEALKDLRGTVIYYKDPFEPAVDPEDWDALKW